MSSESHNAPPRVYPSPTLVLGVGRLGLAVLEQLGEDWRWLTESAQGDASLANLRLLHVKPEELDEAAWRASEQTSVSIAQHVGGGDQASLAVDLLILRALGLVRYRDGSYQVAVPKDAGLVEQEPAPDGATGERSRVVRRRFFSWQTLSPDPMVAADRLQELSEANSALDLFITPLINRVRQGHSPQLILACVGRCRALAQGRDPSPWTWLDDYPAQSNDEPATTIPFEEGWIAKDREGWHLEGIAPKPLHGWPSLDELIDGEAEESLRRLTLRVPTIFEPQAQDPRSPLNPSAFLHVDWEATGWATEGLNTDNVTLTPAPCSPFRLGLFDHDGTTRSERDDSGHLAARLRELAAHSHRGLVRLWVDLGRIHAGGAEVEAGDRQRERAFESTRQCLEILGELLVRSVIESPAEVEFPNTDARHDAWLDDAPLPDEASPQLRKHTIDVRDQLGGVEAVLESRLAALGVSDRQGSEALRRRLFNEVALGLNDLHSALQQDSGIATDAPATGHGLLGLRAVLNSEVRHLFDHGFLTRYRKSPTRRPPRLNVFIVGDAGEPFVRAIMRAVVREIHAELLRAFGPIFVTYRHGIDRALNIGPILWMPHPADAFAGKHPELSRCEEAVIIEAVHGLRRWAETVPSQSLCIPQIFINGRVTDNAVISVPDSIRQTRDFISLFVRNDTGNDHWLRQAATGSGRSDLLSSFVCYQIDFPTRRAREYLANRLARDLLRSLERVGRREAAVVEETLVVEPPDVSELVEEARDRLAEITRTAGDNIERLVNERIPDLGPATETRAIVESFSDELEQDLLGRVHQEWRSLSRDLGVMDSQIDELRRETSIELGRAIHQVRKHSDEVVRKTAGQGGLGTTRAVFNAMRKAAFDQLKEADRSRQQTQQLCINHRIPQTAEIESSRAAILDAAAGKPDQLPMRLGLVAWLAMAPALGAPLIFALAKLLELHLEPSVFEIILGPLGPVVGAIVLGLPVALLLRWRMRRAVRRVREAITDLGDRARRILHGTGGDPAVDPPSVRSFFDTRVRFAEALASSGYAASIREQVQSDAALALRLSRSVDIQEHKLRRRAESIGIRPEVGDASADTFTDDVSGLFEGRSPGSADLLVAPERLQDYYLVRVPSTEKQALLPRFLSEVGGFETWREKACLSDSERVLDFGRLYFDDIVSTPIALQSAFVHEVGANLIAFVARNYPNIGFGAKFIGYEGLDPDGVHILANASLLLSPEMAGIYREARRAPGAPALTETLDIIEAGVRPSTAYVISLAQDIRAHSVHNLKRFESFLDRPHIPDGRIFPQADEQWTDLSPAPPINELSRFGELRRAIQEDVGELRTTREPAQRGRPTTPGDDTAAGAADDDDERGNQDA